MQKSQQQEPFSRYGPAMAPLQQPSIISSFTGHPVVGSSTGGGGGGGGAASGSGGIWLNEPFRTAPLPVHWRSTDPLHVPTVPPLDVELAAPDDEVEVDELDPEDEDVDDVEEDEDVGSDDSFPPHAIATTDEVANAASNRRRSATEDLPIPL